METYYQTLGISELASSKDIKRAFRLLALKYHPDRNLVNKKECHEKMTKINQAYAVLIDPISRSEYDSILQWQRQYPYATRDTAEKSKPTTSKESFFRRNWQFVFYAFIIVIKLLHQADVSSTKYSNSVPVYYQTSLSGNQSIPQLFNLRKDYKIECMYKKK